jgi:hypothetical protein
MQGCDQRFAALACACTASQRVHGVAALCSREVLRVNLCSIVQGCLCQFIGKSFGTVCDSMCECCRLL